MANITGKKESSWTFLTNHAHVMLCLAKSSSMRARDLASEVGITERAVQRIIAELIEGDYIERFKDGRRNLYKIRDEKPLKHPIESHKKIKDLIKLIFEE